MRRWLVGIIVEALTQFYERTIRPDVRLCGHGYIGATCELCMGRGR
jgi:hypothetical protein